jgi:hypothetical protein
MNLHLPFFNLNSAKSRAIIAGAGAASFYGWLQYTSPDALMGLLDVNSILADPLNPIMIIPPLVAAGGVFIPRFIKMPGKIGLPKIKKDKAGGVQYVESGATLLEFGKNQGKGAKDAPKAVSAGSSQPAPASAPAQPKEAPAPQPAPAASQATPASAPAQIDESKLSSIVENKTGKIAEEVESVKKDMSSIKEDMQSLKNDIKELSSTFESSLVELKAFQSEMVNPVNFMRKYFELLDIKNVSDPVNAMMPIEQLVNNVPDKQGGSEPAVRAKTDMAESHSGSGDAKVEAHNSSPGRKAAAQTSEEFTLEEVYDMLRQKRSEDLDDDEDEYRTRRSADAQPSIMPTRSKMKGKVRKKSVLGEENEEILRSSLESGLTPGKIMSIVSIVDEILASMGPDGIELILEQYRAIGLKPEEERLIYGVVKMLNESKLLTDDIIAMLYRFGQVLGINDQDAELQYTKIVANKRDRKKRMSRDLTDKGDE